MSKYFSTSLITIFSLLFLFIASCSDNENNKKKDSPEVIEKEGILYDKDSGKLYTGKIKAKVYGKMIEYDVKDGLKNGDFKTFFENGKLEMTGRILNNKNVGHWKYFFKSGAIESEGKFSNDLADDKWTWYYETGKTKEAGYFKNGKRDGKWNSYDSIGNLIQVTFFKNGEKIKIEKQF